MSFDYAVLVSSADLTAALEARAKGGSRAAADLLGLVSQAQPISQNTDLFRYVLKDSYHFSIIQSILVDEVDAGRAAVYEATTGNFLPSVQVTRSNGASSRTRDFETVSGERILWSLDCIAD